MARLRPAAKAGAEIDFRALVGEAVLHFERDGSAKRIQSEHGIVGEDHRAIDRNRRDQIPIDDITESFVDADAVLINRKALRRARYGRGGEAAIRDGRLEGMAGAIRDG